MTIGQRIQQARKENNLTQKELAAKLGLATGSIQQYELDKRQPRLEQLRAIAAALNVDPCTLMDFDMASDYLSERMNNRAQSLLSAFDQLNDEGQCKAVERVEELTEIPKYRKDQ